MARVMVVYFSGYGHTQRVAESVAAGAQAELIEIDLDGNLSDTQWDALDAADALIMGSPTYMGTVAWQFKKFADVSSKRWYASKWKNKVAGGFTISGNPSGDKLSTLQYLVTFAMQHGMIWVGQGEMNNGTINRLGSTMGVMAQVGSTEPAANIPQGDLETAEGYGARLAAITAKLAP